MRNILIEASAVKRDTGLTETIRMASERATSAGTLLDGHFWTPCVSVYPQFNYSVWQNGAPEPLSVSYGSISFVLDEEYENTAWTDMVWQGAEAIIWVGEHGAPFNQYRKIYTGKLGQPRGTTELTVELLGNELTLANRSLLSAEYAGTGGQEGSGDLKGNLKPWSMGFCRNVTPTKIDAAYWIYQVNGYGPTTVHRPYEKGILIAEAPVATVASYAELRALNLREGEYAIAPQVGMFRIGAAASDAVTADIGFSVSAGQIIEALLLAAGQVGRIDPSVRALTTPYDYFQRDQVSILDAARTIALHCGKYLISNSEGHWCLADHFSNKAPISASDATNVRRGSVVKEPTSPAWKVRIGHTRVYTAGGEISSAYAQIGEELDARRAAAQAARERADLAAANAAIALRRIDAWAANNLLERNEKPTLITEVQSIIAERAGLVSAGVDNALELNAYVNAYDALLTYLTSLTPAYTAVDADTVVIGSTMLTTFQTFYRGRQALLNKLAERPVDLIGLDPSAGDKLEGIEPGATHGGTVGPGGNIKNPDGSDFTGIDPDQVKAIADEAIDLVREELAGADGYIETVRAGLASDIATLRTNTDADRVEVARIESKVDNSVSTINSTLTSLATADQSIQDSFNDFRTSFVSGPFNRIANSEFIDESGWERYNVNAVALTFGINLAGSEYHPAGSNVLGVRGPGPTGGESYMGWNSRQFAVTGGEWLQLSVMANAHRARVGAVLYFYNRAGVNVGFHEPPRMYTLNGVSYDPASWTRVGTQSFQVPTGSVSALLQLRKYDTDPGHGDSYAWFWQPFVSTAREGQTSWADYSAGSDKPTVAAATTAITNEASARSTAIDAVTNSLNTAVSNFNTGLANANSAISSNATTAANATSAVAQNLSTLQTDYSNNMARVTNLETAVSNNNSSAVGRLNNIEANFGTKAEITAAVNNEAQARAGQFQSVANQFTGVNSSLGSLSATVSAQQSTIVDSANKLAAARLVLTAGTPGSRASITLRSDNNNGAGVDIVGDVNFAGGLNIGPDSGQRTKITNQGMRVFDGNNVLRVQLGNF